MKRAHDTEIQYAVVETNDDEGVYVEFLPQLWLVQTKDCTLKQRDLAQFYFPRRLQQQSKDSYFRFLKQAKFICLKPQDDGKWETKNGRILKLGLGLLLQCHLRLRFYQMCLLWMQALLKMHSMLRSATATISVLRRQKKNLRQLQH